MVSVLLNWTYILVTAFLTGFSLCSAVYQFLGYRVRQISSIVAAGLVAVTVYAQIFSLFYKVGAAANFILVIGCLAIAVLGRHQIASFLAKAWRDERIVQKIVFMISIIIWCFCTSRGYMHYDSDLYHAQSIRWIEEYGVVKGLGNIHVRFAYNSSFFALSALYSMKFLCGRSLHTVNGFIALLLWTQVLPLFYAQGHIGKSAVSQHTRTLAITNFARFGALYYLTIIYSDIVAPASDYAIMCVVFFIVMKWLSLLEIGEENAAPYALLCVAGVYAVTLKLTAGLILILLVKPVTMLIREKRWRDIGVYIVMGIVTAVPWLARTVIISGYLLYPFPALDLFNVDWKMDAAEAARDAAEIKAYGRGLNNVELVDLPIPEWITGWFHTLPMIGKLLILADLVCLLLFAVLVIREICRVHVTEKIRQEELLVLGAVAASYVFWQFSAPLLRYGYAYILLVFMITLGILCNIFIKYFDKRKKKDIIEKTAVICTVVLVAFSAVKIISLAGYVHVEMGKPAYVWQQDYGKYELESYEVNGVSFYYPLSGDRTGYDSFPSLPRQTEILFRGESMNDGFLYWRSKRLTAQYKIMHTAAYGNLLLCSMRSAQYSLQISSAVSISNRKGMETNDDT